MRASETLGGDVNPSGAHGVTIFIAGYRGALDEAWPGYIGDPSLDTTTFLIDADMNPAGESITVLTNSAITDAAGNEIEPSSDTYDNWNPAVWTDVSDICNNGYSGLNVAMPGTDTDGWDVSPPVFSVYEAGPPPYYEIVSGASAGTGLINRLDFFIRDNYDFQGQWTPQAVAHRFAAANHGVRDSSMATNGVWGVTPEDAFTVSDVNDTTLVNTYNNGLVTDVSNTLFGVVWPAPDHPDDDSYFRLNILETGHGWNAITALQVNYDSTAGLITDLAGNIIPSTAVAMAGVERIPPVIDLSLASVGDDRVYVRFSEPVFGNAAAPRVEIDQNDFNFSIAGVNITGIEPIRYYNDGIIEAWFNLSTTLTADMAVAGRIEPQAASIYDKITNEMSDTAVHKVTDIGIGVMLPVWAADNIHNDNFYGTVDKSLRTFDGTGYLSDSDITIEASIQASSFTGMSSSMYFDVDPAESVLSDGFWLPTYNNALVPGANDSARGPVPFRAEGAVRDFLIPGNDAEMVTGAEVQFLLKLGDLYCADLLNPDDPRSLVPWSFKIKDIVRQAAGVTILNNVINPVNGEKTIINYELPQSGMVVINVFNLAGDLVDVIHRGAQGAGTYTYSWDGTNRAGNIVARGIYFIRVVGPDIDEFRKVMIVK